LSGVESNIIPYGLYYGIRSNLRGLNLVGLKRKNVERKVIRKIQHSYNKIFNKLNPIMKNIKELTNEERSITEINEIIKFIDENIKRGICNP
jgi:UDP-N-acetylglucosamine acyltransferase